MLLAFGVIVIANSTFYRRQWSWGKVMFLHVCVILFTGGVCLSACWDTTPQDQDPPRSRPPQDQASPLLRSRHPPGPGTPPEQSILGDTVNERAVRILLECNLVPSVCDIQLSYFCNKVSQTEQVIHVILDINECDDNNGNCTDNSYCFNIRGSHECRCHRGYSWNATTEQCDGKTIILKNLHKIVHLEVLAWWVQRIFSKYLTACYWWSWKSPTVVQLFRLSSFDFLPKPVADPGFPPGGGSNSPGGAQTYDFAKFSHKLHEIERIWIPRGGARVPRIPP